MKPIPFKEMNKILTTPLGKPEPDCGDLPTYIGGGQIISCWRLDFWDRIRALIFGRIWLGVMGKKTQAPARLDCCRTIFHR
jgi:hypothetical protein